MKKILYLVIATMVVGGFTSCGSQRAVSRKSLTGDIAIKDEPCEEYAMKKPTKRASGMGLHFQETTARNLAELNARAQLARALQTCIESASSSYSGGTTLFTVNEEGVGVSINDQSATVDDREASLAKELVQGAPVVKISKYKTPDNQFRVFVCVEYSEEVVEMAAKVAKVFNERLTPEQKMKVKFDEEMFRKKVEESFASYSGATM